MGAQLVGRAFVFAADHRLTGNEMRLLLWMARTALDGDDQPRYFASREESAFGLGDRLPEEPDPAVADDASRAARAVRAASFQRVKVAVNGLVAKGAISVLRRGREGQRAEYLVLPGVGRLPGSAKRY
ncbi:hypothetical protein HQQ80_09365 [Microbacteriaceae bacterium VKM Ac-2855]|nr:hypothetical protein [Microbacteriaceae bacterium VKM Ac-2855]